MEAKKDPRGRKPVKDKKHRIDLFVEASKIKKLGKPKILRVSYNAIEKALENKNGNV
jgi:hypothetical protein